MAQPIGLALCPLDLVAVIGELLLAGAALLPKPFDLRCFDLKPGERVKQPAMGRHLHQRALVMLPMDFHQSGSQCSQRLGAHGLVIDKGAGAAVGELGSPQDQLVLRRNAVRDQEIAHRVCGRQLEYRGDLALLDAVTDERGIAARAQRKRKGIEQDRLSGTGLAGQHGEAEREVDVQAVDQHNVADGEPGQHRVTPH